MSGKKNSWVQNWGTIEHDILMKIFMMLNTMDLISVAHVCSSWRAVSSDSDLWKTLDLSKLRANFISIPQQMNTSSDQEAAQRLMGFMKCALRLGQGNVTSLIFHFHVLTTNELFIWASQSSPNLRRLVLPAWNVMSVDGFETAIKNWKGLVSLTVPCLRFCAEYLKAIGTHCKNFSELKVMCPFDTDFARAIAAYIPNLTVLSLQAIMVHKEALVYILDKLEHLEVLNISHCLLIEEDDALGYFLEQKLLDQSILERSSRLKTFLFCRIESCNMCQRVIRHEGILMWGDQNDQEIWKNDEVRSLAF